MKYESVSRFLVNEEQKAKNNLRGRSEKLLKQALEFESKNEQKMVKEILQSALEELNAIKQKVPEDVYQASFESALEGIGKGFADYKKDLVLKKIQQKIEEKVKKIQALSPEEIQRLISLTTEQLQHLKNMDQNQKKDFFSQQPVLDQGVKNLDSVQEKLKNWSA